MTSEEAEGRQTGTKKFQSLAFLDDLERPAVLNNSLIAILETSEVYGFVSRILQVREHFRAAGKVFDPMAKAPLIGIQVWCEDLPILLRSKSSLACTTVCAFKHISRALADDAHAAR